MASVRDVRSAVDFAAKRELASISFYENIKQLVSKAQHEAIDRLIAEEKGHFVQLTNLKKCM
jgi:rubrerythrin